MAHCHFLVPVFGWTGTAPTLLNKQTNKPKQGYAGVTPTAWSLKPAQTAHCNRHFDHQRRLLGDTKELSQQLWSIPPGHVLLREQDFM